MTNELDLARLRDLVEKATPGPWAVEACGEKGDGAYMIGVVFHPNDPECKSQLAGSLPDCDDDGNFIEYYRDELVAECDFHNRNGGYDSDLIALTPTLARTVLSQAEEIAGWKECMRSACDRANIAENTVRQQAEEIERLKARYNELARIVQGTA